MVLQLGLYLGASAGLRHAAVMVGHGQALQLEDVELLQDGLMLGLQVPRGLFNVGSLMLNVSGLQQKKRGAAKALYLCL
jgi:hypothetical protein